MARAVARELRFRWRTSREQPASAAAVPSAALGSGTREAHPAAARIRTRDPRSLSAPDTSEIVPMPFTRESMPVIVNTSGAAVGVRLRDRDPARGPREAELVAMPG